jgi:glycosyltransferase involved in cell wall biosynthesis
VIRLGIDATSVAPEGKGIARVQRGTVRALAKLGRFELVVYARRPDELPEVQARRVTWRPTLAWEQLGLARAAREVDVLLTWTERLPLVGSGRFVVWMFEPPTHRIEQNRQVGARAWQRGSDAVTSLLWRRSLGRAAVVLTGSQATADAVRHVTPARPLYPGLDERFSPGTAARDGSVLHIGSNDPRDDTPTALAAARQAGERLVVVGGYAGPADGAELAGRVTDEELVDHYRRADAFLDTSLYEGFGFQVLEAMACGTPVVASDTTSIPELVGDAALLCPPGDVEAFAAALRRLRTEAEVADGLRRRGLARAAEFTWERTAEQLADAVEEAARA